MPMDLRTYGIGAQILRDLGVGRMKLLGSPRRMPSLLGYGLEVTGFLADEPVVAAERRSSMRNAERGEPVAPRRPRAAHRHRPGALQRRAHRPHRTRVHRRAARARRRPGRHHPHHACPARSRSAPRSNALADADEHDALVAIGCVLRGETYHFELVANESGAAGHARVDRPRHRRRQRDPDLRHAGAGRGSRRREGPRRGARRGRDGQPARRAVVSASARPLRRGARPARRDRPKAEGAPVRELGDESAARAQRPRAAARRSESKSARRRAREFALQGLYEWLLNGADAGVVDAHVREQEGFDKCDLAHFDLLLHGVIREAAAIDAVLAAPHRPAAPSCSRRSSTRR